MESKLINISESHIHLIVILSHTAQVRGVFLLNGGQDLSNHQRSWGATKSVARPTGGRNAPYLEGCSSYGAFEVKDVADTFASPSLVSPDLIIGGEIHAIVHDTNVYTAETAAAS